MNISTRQKLSKAKMYRSPDGKVQYVRLLKEFCQEHNLNVRQMRKLMRGKIDNYKGWTHIVSGKKPVEWYDNI